MKRLAFVGVALLLAGCAEKQIAELSYPELQQLAHQIAERCVKEAGPVGSLPYETCVKQYARQEQYRRVQSKQNAIRLREGLASAPSGFAQGYNNALAAQPRQRNCTTNFVGSSAYTNCY